MFTSTSVMLDEFKCWSCGVTFAVDRDVARDKRVYGKTMHCPNGCCLGFGESLEAKHKKELEAKERTIAWERQRKDQLAAALRDTEETAKREKAALRGSLTKMKNRVGKGVCPCCNRTFQDLHRHMETKHPDFSTSEA